MKIPAKPDIRPDNPNFSSGPCSKRPGWSLTALEDALIGRSHRAKKPLARIREVISLSRKVLGVPENFRVAIVPASDTGAIEMAMWSLLGQRGVDFLTWENFGEQWVIDGETQLKPLDYRIIRASYGKLPDLSQVDPKRDCVFVWNGTTSGVRVPNGDWISSEREGLTICDATSGVLAHEMPWDKLDVVTWSWQKVMGGEAAHGMLVLGPRAVERLETYTPPWPLPKIFRMTKSGRINEGLFKGDTINTPSLLCMEDAIDGLRWAEEIGGLPELLRRSLANLAVLEQWVAKSAAIDFLPDRSAIRSNTSICLKLVDPWFESLGEVDQRAKVKEMVGALEDEGVAYDINGYRDAPPGLRIWGGATVVEEDLEALVPWLDWAFAEVKSRS